MERRERKRDTETESDPLLFPLGDRDMDRRRATFFTLCTYHIKALLPRTYYVAHTLRTKCLQVGLGGCMLTVCSL